MIGSDACRHWFWRGWLVALVALAGGNVWAGPEVWVVNTKSKDIAVIDAATDLEIATIPLGDIDGDGTLDPTAPAPGAIDFSTAPGHAGTHAFVTQGRYLRVVEVITWTVIRVAPDEFTDLSPYAVCLVELDNGVRLMSQLVDVDLEEIEMGLPVKIEFRRIRDDGAAGVLFYGYKVVPA